MKRHIAWFTLVVTTVIVTSLAIPAGAIAQDASPTAGECVAPELPPGSPTPMDEMGEMGGMEMATPAEGEAVPAEGEATPAEGEMGAEVEAEIPAGTPADEATAERVIAAIENAVACSNAGEFLALGALFTPAGLEEEFGITNPYDVEMVLAGGPQLVIDTLGDVQVHEDGRYSADAVYLYGGAQVQHERWFLVDAGEILLIDATPSLPVEAPADAVTIDANMVDYAFELSQDTAPANTPIVFKVTNTGEYRHELLILQPPEGATPEQILDGSVGFEDVTFMGVTFSEGGQPAPDLVLNGLEPGNYTLVCFIDIPDGIPHSARGMIAELVVE